MPSQILAGVENNFTKGLITEATGLNFPENAATSTVNCEYTLIGDVLRREGINQEVNGVRHNIGRGAQTAINAYKWNNAGADGKSEIVVHQVGNLLYFYLSSNSTNALPLSTTLFGGTVNLNSFVVSAFGPDTELTSAEFADGSGYLFVFHPNCNPFYCQYTGGVIFATPITVNIRDFGGVIDGLPVNTRPSVLSGAHLYNLQNQGWTSSALSIFETATGGFFPADSETQASFNDNTGAFNPAVTLSGVPVSNSNAPKGFYILPAFTIDRGGFSGIPGINIQSTQLRPSHGCWFQGRVWYSGINDQEAAAGNVSAYTWSENIYFSQVITNTTQFGNCFQFNDPTSPNLSDLLPTDGGVLQVSGAGPIYKLFPIQNALLIFAANGVFYLTGSQGIGFEANDYTLVKLSAVKSIATTSFVDVNGTPYFWNEEGIYRVQAATQGGALFGSPLHVNPLEVDPITVGTILSFYANIPKQSKIYVRGAYDPVNYIIQWVYSSTSPIDTNTAHAFDSILNFNTVNSAFYPYLVNNTVAAINAIVYVNYPSVNAPNPSFKYPCSFLPVGVNTGAVSFADENDSTFVDWGSVNFISTFTTGYKVQGQGQKKIQIPYLYVYSRLNTPVSYYIQSVWDYGIVFDSNRWSVPIMVNINSPNFGTVERRHRLRGQGYVLQIQVTSVDGQPFDIIGWSVFETINAGV